METIQLLGSLGEFFGSIGVLITLIYLATQVRQTQRAINANTYQSTTDTSVGLFSIVASSATLSEAMTKANAGESLTAVERTRASNIYRGIIRNYENFFFQSQQGTLPEGRLEEFGMRLGRVRWGSGESFIEVWQQDRELMSEDFVAWAEVEFDKYAEAQR